jgi:hypothetical protein
MDLDCLENITRHYGIEMGKIPNSIHFSTGTNGVEVLRISKDGIWANPDIPVDEAAKLVLNAIDKNIMLLLQTVIRQEREACAKVCDDLDKMRGYSYADKCATAIRARSNYE